jgi:hypothetical protein
MTLVPLNKYELDFIITILKYFKIRITEEISQKPLKKTWKIVIIQTCPTQNDELVLYRTITRNVHYQSE